MKTSLDCVPCFTRQTLEAARYATDDPALHERIVREALTELSQMDLNLCPPILARTIHRKIRAIVGVEDPYEEAKKRLNRLALSMEAECSRIIAEAPDPLFMALRLAIAGNVIDMGVYGVLDEEHIRRSIDRTLHEPFQGCVEEFRAAINNAERILYLADNAGEIFFDRLLIEQLSPERVTLAVRGAPILNDATRRDVNEVGFNGMVKVIDNGSDAPGTVLSDCSEEFRRTVRRSDLLIAKGQGNYETLSDENLDIYFLLKLKCPVIADHAGAPVGTHIARRHRRRAEA